MSTNMKNNWKNDTDQSPVERYEAIVIGAGLSGLSAAKALSEQGVQVVVLEVGNQIAEPWRGRHPQLRLNIDRQFASLPGRLAPTEDGTFLKRDTVVSYLESYAAALDVSIRFGTQVKRIHRDGKQWIVTTDNKTLSCENLVIATGRDRVPHIPSWEGKEEFKGIIRHASELGEIGQYSGKHVLVVGAGNSGSDVLNHLAKIRPAEVWVSVRQGPSIVPMRLLGFPLHRLAKLFALVPAKLLDPMFAVMQRLVFGDMTRFGMPESRIDGGTRLLRDGVTFAMDDGFVAAIKSGRFKVVRETARFNSESVQFSDGFAVTPDVVICATGYQSGLRSLVGHLAVLDENGQVRHPMGEQDKFNPGLWFTGYRPTFTGYFDAARIAAERITKRVVSTSDRPKNAGSKLTRTLVGMRIDVKLREKPIGSS